MLSGAIDQQIVNSNRLDIADALLGLVCGLAMLAYWSIEVLILNGVDDRGILPGWMALSQMGLSLLVLLFTGLLFHLVFLLLSKKRPGTPREWLRQYGPQWLRYCFFCLIIMSALAVYTPIKQSIFLVQGNSIDVFLMHMMWYVGFGDFPWHRLQPLLGHPLVTVGIDRIYTAGAATTLWLTTCVVMMQPKNDGLPSSMPSLTSQ